MKLERENFQNNIRRHLGKRALRRSAFAGLFIVSSILSSGKDVPMHNDPELPAVSDALAIPTPEVPQYLSKKPMERTVVDFTSMTESAPKPSAAVVHKEQSRITGYYCKQIPGFPKGDGGGYCGNTASGKPVKEGMAACGDNWPLGTKIEIQAKSYDRKVTCEDRGHLASNQVDIFFLTNEELFKSNHPSCAYVNIVK